VLFPQDLSFLLVVVRRHQFSLGLAHWFFVFVTRSTPPVSSSRSIFSSCGTSAPPIPIAAARVELFFVVQILGRVRVFLDNQSRQLFFLFHFNPARCSRSCRYRSEQIAPAMTFLPHLSPHAGLLDSSGLLPVTGPISILVFSSSQDLAQVRAGNEAGLRYVLPRGDCSNLGFWSVSQFVLVTLTRFSLPCLLVCRRRTWCWYSSRFPLARAQVSSSITTDYHRICRCSRSSVFSV
jgi:hypothetical protein